MMLLEMVGGRKNREKDNIECSSDAYFPNWIYDNIAVNVPSCEVICDLEETMRKMALVGLWCIQTNLGNRPTMSKVIDMLEKSINELEMPLKPFLSCPSCAS
uniref:Receptor-like protein kinase n=1 Tax=Triticum urartu TaxID=4572 RepID=A0A8R7TT02_TRIUA